MSVQAHTRTHTHTHILVITNHLTYVIYKRKNNKKYITNNNSDAHLTTVPLKHDKILMVLEDRSSTIEQCIGHHTQGEEVSSRVKSVGEGILWCQVVQGRLTDGLMVGRIFLKRPEGLMKTMVKYYKNDDIMLF